jgi:hypothetical protein
MKDFLTKQHVTMIVGILSISLGLVYYVNLPQMTNDAISTTTLWGRVALFAGLLTALSTLLKRTGWVVSSALLVVIIFLQIPPVALWFIFNGTIVGEYGTTSPVGHWAWAVPHILLAMLSVKTIFLWKRKQIS